MATRANSLADLKVAWGTSFKKRADGGWWALSGFSLQMMAALERMLKRELIEKKPRGEVGLEAVSDAILGENKTYLVQIKRHLTKAALEAAFAEAYDIASLCSNRLQAELRFQVVTMGRDKGAVLDVALARRAVRDRATIDQALLQTTLGMFDATAPIRVTANPAQALRIVLWNGGVENPSATMNAMLGEVFQAFDGRNRPGVQDALIRALDRANSDVRVARAQFGHLYLPGDLEILAGQPDQEILVDASPRMPDLKMGRFLGRVDLLERTLEVALRWNAGLDAHVTAQLPSLPVFCIRGRSGDGKSVLLLQLVAALLERRSIATLTGLASVNDLRGWLASRPKVMPGDYFDGVELAYIDDLPRRADPTVMAELIAENVAFGSRPAALLTCGVSEDVPKTANIHFEFFNMPPPSTQDLERFSEWFGTRAPHAYDAGQSLAAMLSYLRRTSADEAPLADQLKQRLAEQGLWPTALQVIAANLLGVAGSAPPGRKTALAAFSFEQAGIAFRADQRDGGFELGHAEYLEPIYRDWLEGTVFPEAWGRDLGLAIAAALQNGEPRLARMLLGRMVDVRLMRSRLALLGLEDGQAVANLLNEAFATAQAEADDIAMAPVMGLWVVAQRITKGSFRHVLEARAAALLDNSRIAQGHKAEIAIQLVKGGSSRDSTDSPYARASVYLEAIDDIPMVIEYFTRRASGSGGGKITRVHRWLVRHRQSFAAAPVLSAAIRAGGPHASVYRTMGFRLVEIGPDNPALSELVRTLVQEPIEPYNIESLDRWLAHAHPAQALTAIYAQLLKVRGKRQYVARAIDWLSSNIGAPDTHDLLVRLIEMRPYPNLLPLIHAWLSVHASDDGRYSVIGAMLKQPRLERSGLRLALTPLSASQRTPHTGYLAAFAGPVVRDMTVHEVYTLAKTLPPKEKRVLETLRGLN